MAADPLGRVDAYERDRDHRVRVNLAIAAATAAAAFAAWRAAKVSGQEAAARREPYVAAGTPRFDLIEHTITVPLKNLGLGPARTIAMRFTCQGREVTGNLRAGLAPMESDEWTLPAIMDDELPDILSLEIEGICTNAAGERRPVYPWGGADPLPPPSFKGGDDLDAERTVQDAFELQLAYNLRVLRNRTRTTYDGTAYALEWANFWRRVPRDAREPNVEKIARDAWDQLERARHQEFMTREQATPSPPTWGVVFLDPE